MVSINLFRTIFTQVNLFSVEGHGEGVTVNFLCTIVNFRDSYLRQIALKKLTQDNEPLTQPCSFVNLVSQADSNVLRLVSETYLFIYLKRFIRIVLEVSVLSIIETLKPFRELSNRCSVIFTDFINRHCIVFTCLDFDLIDQRVFFNTYYLRGDSVSVNNDHSLYCHCMNSIELVLHDV